MKRSNPLILLTFATIVPLGSPLFGCSKPGQAPGPARPRPDGPMRLTMEPIQIVAHKSGAGYKTEAFSADELFRKGYAAQRKDQCHPAEAAYRRLLRYFSKSRFAAAAHYNLALCLQRRQRWAEAGRHFDRAAQSVDKASDKILALGAAGVNYADAGRWTDSRRCFKALIARRDLRAYQRLEALTRLGLTWFKTGNFSKARDAFDKALRFHRLASQAERLPNHFYAAMAAYYRAGLYHEKVKESPIRLPVEQMQQDVEEMATWMYKAQRGYWDVVKYKDHFWSMAAVYQVGTLYWEFRKHLLAAPLPRFYSVRYFDKTLKRYEVIRENEQRTEYFRKLRAKTKILLRHAMTVYQKGVATAERIGANNIWVTRMKKALAEVKHRYAKEPDAATQAESDARRRSRPGRSPLLPSTVDPKRFHPAALEL